MNKTYDKDLALKGMKAKKPIRIFNFFAFIWMVGVLGSSIPENIIDIDNPKDTITNIGVLIIFSYCFYVGILDGILDRIDIKYDRQVMFTGKRVDIRDFHGYRFDSRMGIGIVVEINGKKKTLYEYYPLRKTRRLVYTNIGDEVKGVYLKHSKLILELEPIHPREKEKKVKRKYMYQERDRKEAEKKEVKD